MAEKIPVKLCDGREFRSIADASRELGMKYTTLYIRLETGTWPFSNIKPVRGRKKQKIYYKGKMYPSTTDAAKQNNITMSSVSQYRKKNKSY